MSEEKSFVSDSRRKNWFWDYNEVFNSSLSSHAILVRLYLARCADAATRKAFPSLKNIAEHCKLSRATVKRAINELIEKGWLVKESRKDEEGDYDTNLYTLCDPPKTCTEEEDKGGRLRENLPCNEMTSKSEPKEGGWAQGEPTVGSQRTQGWVQGEPTVGSQRATNNTHLTILNNNNNIQQDVVVNCGVDDNLPEEHVEELCNYAQKRGIRISKNFATVYISMAGGLDEARELVASCASYIENERKHGREIRSVSAILCSAAKNFLVGASIKSDHESSRESIKNDKFSEIYLT